MNDVRVELCSIPYILNKLNVFRNGQPDRYKTSFINLSLPELLEPLILLDILTIDICNSKNDVTLSNYDLFLKQWYQPIQEYSLDSVDSDNDSDMFLLVKVIYINTYINIYFYFYYFCF